MKRVLLAIILIMLCLSAAPRQALAYDPFNGVDCSDKANASSTVCSDKPATDPTTGKAINPLTGSDGILAKITNIVSYAGGAAAVIVIIISGLRFVTSGSDVSTGSRTDTDVENARRGLASALIGLAIIVLARTLMLFILKRL